MPDAHTDPVLNYPNEFPLRDITGAVQRPPEFGRMGTVRLDPNTLEVDPDSFEEATIIEVDLKESTEVEGDEPDVWGISFPKAMLPIGADQGYWTSEPLLDLDGDESEELVRVWLHAPAYKWPQSGTEANPPEGT